MLLHWCDKGKWLEAVKSRLPCISMPVWINGSSIWVWSSCPITSHLTTLFCDLGDTSYHSQGFDRIRSSANSFGTRIAAGAKRMIGKFQRNNFTASSTSRSLIFALLTVLLQVVTPVSPRRSTGCVGPLQVRRWQQADTQRQRQQLWQPQKQPQVREKDAQHVPTRWRGS